MVTGETDETAVSGLVEQIVAPLCAMSALPADPSNKLDETRVWQLSHERQKWLLKLACRGPYCVISVQGSEQDLEYRVFYARSQNAAQSALTELLRRLTTLRL